jgi:hypothetical protein
VDVPSAQVEEMCVMARGHRACHSSGEAVVSFPLQQSAFSCGSGLVEFTGG